ncbi:uncharacterized protein CTRU02_207830 [Colletotrichum truncatum]|uniref:Uncharacterized protein n=1 Tax=Colletotrichum truncatum TaxID=5467 RepID=A0ACC3Z211_COLTU|nr:uncharacterized protein CTRU02_15174 [Colletotrichum truncatum]KAF6781391.1 hypothetical protein CTRU02_15174 [Colletotrichum truncatum]
MKFLALISSVIALIIQVTALELQAPPNVEPLFNITIFANPIPHGPVAIQGGEQVVLTVAFGAITGALEATIKGGVVYPSFYENGTIWHVEGKIWGTTKDGIDFFADEVGIGGPVRRLNRLTFNIGGGHAYLTTAYIITVPTQLNNTVILSQAFLIN